MTDAERLDWLEDFINREGGIMLHDGSKSNFGCAGIGLRPGFMDRTLRDAIDAAAGVAIRGEGHGKG